MFCLHFIVLVHKTLEYTKITHFRHISFL
ncbi:hypothetical protein E2C01_084537 [Portunus trituberculatus]|uniref:Uncharacterized protein n=1 Tax=Portunus trituberculatus TaxID=210409 RepID=A0A5B7J537_PORTR|nr:hypothetical protein [Portunus trituberculatus]